MRSTNPVTGMGVGEVKPADFLCSNETSSKDSRSSKQYDSHAIHRQTTPVGLCHKWRLVDRGLSPHR